jgi:hypothetical protein
MATVKVLPISLLYSIAVFSGERALYPIYGQVPTRLHLVPVVCASTFWGTILQDVSRSTALFATAVWLFAMPHVARHAGVFVARELNDAVVAPIVTNAALLAPLMVASAAFIKTFVVSLCFTLSEINTLHKFTLSLLRTQAWNKWRS